MPDAPPDRPGEFLVDAVDADAMFRQAMSQTRLAMCLTDPHQKGNPLVFVNEAFRRMTGYEEGELLGRNCRLLQGPDTDAETVARLRGAVGNEEVVAVELLNYRRDGSPFWNSLHVGPIHDSEGELRFHFGSQWDISDVREARARRSVAELVSRELAHRMKNMFSVISGIVSISSRHEGVPRVAHIINERIAALGRAHDNSLTHADFQNIELGRIVHQTLAPYMDGMPTRIIVRGERVTMPPTTVSLIGLVLHELATNALKHGALAAERGRITLDWAFDGDRALVLEWRESRDQEAHPAAPTTTGPRIGTGRGTAGRGVIGELVSAAGGRLDIRSTGNALRVRISLPIGIVRSTRPKEHERA